MSECSEAAESVDQVQIFEAALPVVDGGIVLPSPILVPDISIVHPIAIPRKSVVREIFEFLVVTVIVALFGMTFLVQGMKVPTGSMQNTIEIGDHLLVAKFPPASYSILPLVPQRKIGRGDVIVFKYPGYKYDPDRDRERGIAPFSLNYVKRVIGIPGDVIEMSGREVKVNGAPANEDVVIANEPCNSAPDSDPCHKGPLEMVEDSEPGKLGAYGVFYEPGPEQSSESYPVFQNEGDGRRVTVPDDAVFVMGDNRDNSEDSRYWGFVKQDLIVGRAMLIYWSYDESLGSSGNPISDFIYNSRWRRSGTMIK